MIGIDAVLSETDGVFDMSIGSDGDFVSSDSFDTAIIVSLLTDARSAQEEEWHASHRRGWIGNEVTPDFQMGSTLWQLFQRRITQSLLNDATNKADLALRWFVDLGYATRVGSQTLLQASGILLEVHIYRPNSEVDKRYFELWNNTGVS